MAQTCLSILGSSIGFSELSQEAGCNPSAQYLHLLSGARGQKRCTSGRRSPYHQNQAFSYYPPFKYIFAEAQILSCVDVYRNLHPVQYQVIVLLLILDICPIKYVYSGRNYQTSLIVGRWSRASSRCACGDRSVCVSIAQAQAYSRRFS